VKERTSRSATNRNLFERREERELLRRVEPQPPRCKRKSAGQYEQALERIAASRKASDVSSIEVMVMAENEAVRKNRWRWRAEYCAIHHVADFSEIGAEGVISSIS